MDLIDDSDQLAQNLKESLDWFKKMAQDAMATPPPRPPPAKKASSIQQSVQRGKGRVKVDRQHAEEFDRIHLACTKLYDDYEAKEPRTVGVLWEEV